MKYKLGNTLYSCPLILSLEAISGKWKGVIIWFLMENPVLRFSNLKVKITSAIKISDKMLIQSLKELERDGLIKRKVYKVVPPKVEYSLTQRGKELKSAFHELIQFGLRHEKKDS